MEQELAFTTLAYISNDLLKAVYEKKSDVICNSLPLGCDGVCCPWIPCTSSGFFFAYAFLDLCNCMLPRRRYGLG